MAKGTKFNVMDDLDLSKVIHNDRNNDGTAEKGEPPASPEPRRRGRPPKEKAPETGGQQENPVAATVGGVKTFDMDSLIQRTKKVKRVRKGFDIPVDLSEKLKKLAIQCGTSETQIVTDLLRQLLD